MSRSSIDFVHPRWSIASFLMVGAVLLWLAAAIWMYLTYQEKQNRLQAEIARLENVSITSATTSRVERKAVPPWMQEAEDSLRHDWNGLFTRLEENSVEGVKLLSVQAGTHPANARLEFELDGWIRVSELNEALNQQSDSVRWNLQSVNPSTGGNVVTGPVRAVWTR